MSNHALLVLGLVVGLTMTIAVGFDAHSRGRNGVLWGLLTFFTGLLGAFVYALVLLTQAGADDDPETVRTCAACGATNAGTPEYCSDCGEPLTDGDDAPVASIIRSGSKGYCSNCQSEVGLDADACANCGAVL